MLVYSISQITNNKIYKHGSGNKKYLKSAENYMTLPSFADAKSLANINFKAAIHGYAAEGNWKGVKKELQKVNVNAQDAQGKTALIWAADNESVEVVEKLLEHPDVDVTIQDNQGHDALYWARWRNSDDMVRMIEDYTRGVDQRTGVNKATTKEISSKPSQKQQQKPVNDINLQDNDGNTPLIRASRKGNIDEVEKLLQHPDIDVNVKNKNGNTALIWASYRGDADVVEKLIQHPDINMNLQNKDGKTALISAAAYGYDDVVETLLKHPDVDINIKDNNDDTSSKWAWKDSIKQMINDYKRGVDRREGVSQKSYVDINKKDYIGETALIKACHNGNADEVEKLLKHPDIDVNVMCKTGFTPLSCACARGYTEIVEKLLQHPNIDVNVQNGVGITALMWASSMGHAEVVEQLIKHPDIDINAQNSDGMTALLWASSRDYADVVEKLLQHPDIDVNKGDEVGNTPLMFASNLGFTKVVKKLLEHPNVDINLKNDIGKTALNYAGIRIQSMIKKYKIGTDKRKVLNKETSQKPVAGINAQDKYGMTPLERACLYKDFDKINELLQNPDIDINARSSNGSTILIKASNSGYADVVEKLLQYPDIDVNAQNDSGFTALIWASHHKYNEVVEKLLEHPDVDINLKDKFGHDALSMANDEIAKMIKNYRKGVDKRDHSKMFPTTKSNWDKIQLQNSEVSKQEYENFRQQLEKIKIDTEKSVRKNETEKIREEERENANKKVAAKITELDKAKVAYEEKNKALDNLINNYQTMLAEDVLIERENLESNFRTLYGVKSENLPDGMGFGEQMLYVVDILNKNKDKLIDCSSRSPKNITKVLQDNNGKISNDGLKFLSRVIEVSNFKCSENDLILAINSVKNDKGFFDMDKVSFFIANLAWGENNISDVIGEIQEYDSEKNN